MPQLDEGGCDELPQALHVGIDAQRVGLLPEQVFQELQVLGVTEERGELAQPRADGEGARRRQAGQQLGLVGGVLHLPSPGVECRRRGRLTQ